MGFLVTLSIALRALAKNKMRAGLTVLGVVIGIAAVTTMVSIGQSASGLIQGELEGFGTNVIIVQPKFSRRRGVRSNRVNTLTSGDCEAIISDCASSVASASPLVAAGGQLVFGNSNYSPNEMWGVGQQYLDVRSWALRDKDSGFFTDENIQNGDRCCVIGKTIVKKLFQTSNPIGQTIRIKNKPFTVIGVLEEKGANMVGQDQDSIVLLPYTTVRKTLQGSNFNEVHAIMVSSRAKETMALATDDIRQLLMERHDIAPGQAADFEVQSTTEIAQMLGMFTGTMTLMLASIAGISLVVGGVGIMNIMLVSVTERTREIGIRMAVGATGRDILTQFLVESVLLSVLGGLVGFALGVTASVGATTLINSFTTGKEWPLIISIPAAITAILFSAAVGVFFGFYPAWRASKLDPINALRYE